MPEQESAPCQSLRRASKSISLVLISSSLILAGCRRPQPSDQDTALDTSRSHTGGGYHGGRYIYYGRGGATPGPSSQTRSNVGTTTRGGFGASGHAAAAS